MMNESKFDKKFEELYSEIFTEEFQKELGDELNDKLTQAARCFFLTGLTVAMESFLEGVLPEESSHEQFN